MNWDMIGALAETVGAVAVVLSLLYLARQLQHGTTQAKASSYSSVMGRSTQWLTQIGADPVASDLYGRGIKEGLRGLEEGERLQFILLVLGLMRLLEESFLLQLHGSLPPWADAAVEGSITDVMATPGYQDFWQIRKHQFAEPFQAYVESLVPEMARAVHGQTLGDSREGTTTAAS